MDAEDAIIDDGCKAQVVEDVRTVPPHVQRAILPEALVVEAINLGDLSAFMVASDQCHQVWVSHFVSQQQ